MRRSLRLTGRARRNGGVSPMTISPSLPGQRQRRWAHEGWTDEAISPRSARSIWRRAMKLYHQLDGEQEAQPGSGGEWDWRSFAGSPPYFAAGPVVSTAPTTAVTTAAAATLTTAK